MSAATEAKYMQGWTDGKAGCDPDFGELALGSDRLNSYERGYIDSGHFEVPREGSEPDPDVTERRRAWRAGVRADAAEVGKSAAREGEGRRVAEGLPRSIDVVACGERVTVEIREAWADIGAITTAARWQAGCGSQAFDNFETRDETGRLLLPHAPVGPWLCGRTLYVNLLGGIGA